MKTMLINATQQDELRVAIIEDLLVDLDIEIPGSEQKKSNIYKGRVTSIEPSLGAFFVDYGSERDGFLPIKEVSPEYFLTTVEHPENTDIRKVLKEGQELVVQIEKEERGTKGAALTTFISLAGSYLVLMPNNPRAGGISRRIEGDERDQIKQMLSKLDIPECMGVIIRTAGVEKSAEELEWDLSVLLKYWEAIKQAAVAKPGPYLIHQESDVIIRAIRDYLRPDIQEIIIDESAAYDRAKKYLSQIRPDFLKKLKLYSDQLPLFSRFQIEQQIEAAYQSKVQLPSGGSIVIHITEALVSIDINSARATKGGNIEETAYNTNLEAADEIARQLRIRDVGGLIVIDFIDMASNKNQRDVENRFLEATHMDRARIQIGRISRFGLLEMSRQRLRASLTGSSQITCPRCSGSGTVRGIESMALSIIHLIQEHASRNNNIRLQVQLPLDTATFLLNEKRELLKDIETYSKIGIVIIPNTNLESPQYQIKATKNENGKSIPSYRIAKLQKIEPSSQRKRISSLKINEPAINKYLIDFKKRDFSRKSNTGIIRRLWDLMFGPEVPSLKVRKLSDLKVSTVKKSKIDRLRGRNPNPNTRLAPESTVSSNKKSTKKHSTRRGSRGGSHPIKSTNTKPSFDNSALESQLEASKRQKKILAIKPPSGHQKLGENSEEKKLKHGSQNQIEPKEKFQLQELKQTRSIQSELEERYKEKLKEPILEQVTTKKTETEKE